jgi:hypothetical protein
METNKNELLDKNSLSQKSLSMISSKINTILTSAQMKTLDETHIHIHSILKSLIHEILKRRDIIGYNYEV